MRLLLLIVAVWLLFMIVRYFWRSALRNERPRQKPIAHTEMVRCAQCGLHIPRSESVEENHRFFCSESHRLSYFGDGDS